jgi:BlaI family transcriptional regulator, penicillinase repressor
MSEQPPLLTKREQQIMEVLFARGQATAVEVWQALHDRPSRTAIRTLLKILEMRGHVTHTQDGREFVYKPSQARTKVGASTLRKVLDTFFEGSLAQAVAAHLTGDAQEKIDDKELAQLQKLIKEARKKGE